jgi:hypothetical protein
MQGLKVAEPQSGRESKPSSLNQVLLRLGSRIDRLDDLLSELTGTSRPPVAQEVAKAPQPCFELVYNTAPKLLDEYIARLDNIAAYLREMLL